ncbi:MAG: Gfo/Idh/MocA family oxidoreductase [Pseudolysinimonas sp.]
MIRIGILGVAHLHVDSYVNNLRVAGVEVAGVFDVDSTRGRAWGAKHGVTFFGSYEQLLAEHLDGVIVCSETSRHLELVDAAARAKLAVLCEKPLGVTVQESQRIVDVCRENDVNLMTAFPSRFDSSLGQARDLVRSGALGRIRAFSGTNQGVMPMRERSWFVDPTLAGGGAIMDHVVHLADLYSWLLGSEPQSVYAVENRIVHSEVVSVETSGMVMVTYPGGVFGSIDCSWNRPLNYPTWGGLALSIVGDGGSLDVEPMRQRLVQFGGEKRYSWIQWGPSANQSMIQDFIDSIADGRPPLSTGDDGNRATRVALAALESVRTSEPVDL